MNISNPYKLSSRALLPVSYPVTDVYLCRNLVLLKEAHPASQVVCTIENNKTVIKNNARRRSMNAFIKVIPSILFKFIAQGIPIENVVPNGTAPRSDSFLMPR